MARWLFFSAFLVFGVPCCVGGDIITNEVRYHLRFSDLEGYPAAVTGSGEALPDAGSFDSGPEISLTQRFDYEEGGKRDPNRIKYLDANRTETIVLFSIEGDIFPEDHEVKFFTWRHEFVLETGEITGWLEIRRGPDSKTRIGYRVEGNPAGRTAGEFVEKMGEGELDRDDELLVTIDAGGRQWTMPVDEWRAAELSDVDAEALDQVFNESLRQDIVVVDRFVRLLSTTGQACRILTAPLLERGEDDACDSFQSARAIARALRHNRKPDCDFDAAHGYPCSSEQRLQSDALDLAAR